ncbi:MAG: nuclear transport factor 2 family protein [Myxococcota bacterium]
MDSATQLTNLLYTYGGLVDAGDFAGIGELLAHAVVTDATGRLELRGADAVRTLYEKTTRRYPDTGTPKTKHVISNPILDIDEDAGRASSTSHYVVWQQTETLPLQAIVTGHYEHTFERIEGTWRIATHRFYVDQVGDVSQHLLVEIG